MAELVFNRNSQWVERPPFPRNMLVELTNACNHNCVFCGYKKMNRKKTVCDKVFMKDIIEQAYKNGTREIGFYMIGEPLLSQDLEEFVLFCKKIGFEYIYLTTNGALADRERMIRLVEAGIQSIKFSVNAATRDTYRKIHGKDDFETVKKNIYDLSGYIKQNKKNTKIFISFVKNNWNVDDETIIHELFDNVVDKVYVFPIANQGGSMMEIVDLKLVDSVQNISRANIPCDMIFNRLHITVEGYLCACCADCEGMLNAVDLHIKSLKEAWNDDVLMALRRRHLKNDLNGLICYNCANNTAEQVYPLVPELCSENIILHVDKIYS